jgi:hypothetical protein
MQHSYQTVAVSSKDPAAVAAVVAAAVAAAALPAYLQSCALHQQVEQASLVILVNDGPLHSWDAHHNYLQQPAEKKLDNSKQP